MNKALLFAILSLLQSVSSFFSSHQILPQVSLRLEMSNLERGLYLERLVAKKKVEVENLLRRHQAADDPLVLRLNYAASECKMNLSRALRLDGYGEEKLHTMSITVDMKRRSPTLPDARSVVEFEDAGHFGQLLTQVGVDALLVNTDEMEYGGKVEDLKIASKAVRSARPGNPPACICKDIILHPIQIAQALENGASGVLLMTGVVGGDLETLLDSCTLMGTEALVEVHTPNEVDFALSRGATNFLVNMWDRMTGKLFSKQASAMASMFPMNSINIAGGNIHSPAQIAELGFYGYDGLVLGRHIADIPDIKEFVDDVHSFKGAPRDFAMTLGMKSLPLDY